VSVDRAFAEVEAELGPCDVLVNNAGIKGTQNAERLAPWFEKQNAEALGGRVVTPLDALVRLEDDEWHGMLAVHLNGTFYCSRAAARQMVPNGGGTIVNVASICGLEGCAGHAHHSAAKARLHARGREGARPPGRPRQRHRPRLHRDAAQRRDRQRRGPRDGQHPGGALRPEEIAATAVFLASDEASYFVGDTLTPSGGYVTV
jgi:3-oxoacyl-[acyl-carrier protein] reductase